MCVTVVLLNLISSVVRGETGFAGSSTCQNLVRTSDKESSAVVPDTTQT